MLFPIKLPSLSSPVHTNSVAEVEFSLAIPQQMYDVRDWVCVVAVLIDVLVEALLLLLRLERLQGLTEFHQSLRPFSCDVTGDVITLADDMDLTPFGCQEISVIASRVGYLCVTTKSWIVEAVFRKICVFYGWSACLVAWIHRTEVFLVRSFRGESFIDGVMW